MNHQHDNFYNNNSGIQNILDDASIKEALDNLVQDNDGQQGQRKQGNEKEVSQGGLQDGPVKIEEIRKREFKKLELTTMKRLQVEPKPLLLEAK